jgi:predicted ABC-type transport system involved in lysophospholipase L1 biosynthesis ATPase subunit
MDLLLNVQRSRAATLVLVTHDADLAALADTRLVLRDGRPVTPDDALRNTGTAPKAQALR